MVVLGALDGGIKELIPPPGSTAKPCHFSWTNLSSLFVAMNCLIRTIWLHLQLQLLGFGFVCLFFFFLFGSLLLFFFFWVYFFLFQFKKILPKSPKENLHLCGTNKTFRHKLPPWTVKKRWVAFCSFSFLFFFLWHFFSPAFRIYGSRKPMEENKGNIYI